MDTCSNNIRFNETWPVCEIVLYLTSYQVFIFQSNRLYNWITHYFGEFQPDIETWQKEATTRFQAMTNDVEIQLEDVISVSIGNFVIITPKLELKIQQIQLHSFRINRYVDEHEGDKFFMKQLKTRKEL